MTPQEYPLAPAKISEFKEYSNSHSHGTIIRFEKLNDGVKHSFDFLAKIIALYFRFSLLDKSFKIFLNDKQVTYEHLNDLADKTEFLWRIGRFSDPYVESLEKRFAKKKGRYEKRRITIAAGITGFIGGVEKPKDLKIMTTDERVGVDLFVNGRLRERDVLKHIPTASIVESYLYGQIHFNGLDDKKDRFTTSREGILADDPKYQAFLKKFRKVLLEVVEDWDRWRIKHRKPGDRENPRISKTQRASADLYNAVAQDYEDEADKVEGWVVQLGDDAKFNFESYAECFVSENLLRKYIIEKKISLSPEAEQEAKKWKDREKDSKNRGNVSISIRRAGGDLSYLSMDDLANLVDKPKDRLKEAGLARDAAEFKPIRDALAHTALLTEPAKKKLTTVRENIKARVKTLLSPSEEEKK